MKQFYKSKTLWANALAIGCYAGKHLLGIDQLPSIDPMILALINIALRHVTKEPIHY